MADSSENSLCATTIRHSYENRPRPTVFVGAGFKPAPQYQRHPHTVIPAESLPRTPIRGRNPVPGHLPCEDGQADPFSSSRVSATIAMADSSENSLCATTIRHSYENRPRPTVFVGAGFKPAPQYQRHPHTVIPAESLPRTPIRGRNPVPGHLPCEDGQADPFSSSRVSATIAMADSSENSLCATTIRHSYENRPRPTVFVGAGFKPAPQYQRHPTPSFPRRRESILHHQPCNYTETTDTFIPNGEGCHPHDIFRTHPPTPVIPNAAKRSEESKVIAPPDSFNTQYSLLPSSLRALRGEPRPRT